MRDIDRDNDDATGDIIIRAQEILHAVKHPDTSLQMEESRKTVWDKISSKTEADLLESSFKGHRIYRYLSIASVVAILIISVSSLTYFGGYHSATRHFSETHVEVNVPAGTTSRLTLSDGTEVVLNGGSKLTYPASFTNERHISLRGEGFFDVAKDLHKPFFVHSENLSVKVLGTRFGFKAYTDDTQTVVTLEEGSVNAIVPGEDAQNNITLLPHQQIIVDNLTKKFEQRNVTAYDYISWKDGILTFRNLTMQEISTLLERYFGRKINIMSEDLKKEQYTAQFKHAESLEEILEKLSYRREWKYKKHSDRIEITTN